MGIVARGGGPQVFGALCALSAFVSGIAHAEPTLPPSDDLDGLYVWAGPTGAASKIDGSWDSTVGGEIAILRVHEHDTLGSIGGDFGASRWTERGGGRIWADAVAGTRIAGWMMGATIGPFVELSDLAHPRLGGSIGLWAFVGPTPFVRVGAVEELGAFVEIGVHLALPVWRH